MKRLMYTTVFVLILFDFGLASKLGSQNSNRTGADPLPTFALKNGQWFDGKTFRRKTFFSVNGILTTNKPKVVHQTIDLNNTFIVPPFGEAHNHNLGQPRGIENQIRMYLREGVFYSKNQNNIRLQTEKVLNRLNQPFSIDIAFANGGLAASGGHVVALYERFLSRGFFRGINPDWKKEDLDTKAFFIIDNQRDLENKWNTILNGKPDFIKTYIEYSEEYERRKDNPKYYGKRGLNPVILRQIVEKAHKANLRVSTHIETASDFRNAILAGVDEIVHLPGYNIPKEEKVSKFQISKEDAKLAASNGVVVITTTYLSNNLLRNDREQLELVRKNYVRNLKMLQRAGVKIAIGSDSASGTSLAEAINLHELRIFSNLALLRYWCEVTPNTIFPKRKLGRLEDGFEASFLSLEGNPLEDFVNVRRIVKRFKQGRPINLILKEEEKLINLILIEGVETAIRVSAKAKKKNPNAYKFGEFALNNLGYQFLGEKKIKDAIQIFKLITVAFPKSANAYDSLAEAFMINGDKELAIKNYRKSLELNPQNEGAKKKLKDLINN